MTILNFIIWNGSPEIVNLGPITLRWYGLLWALGFLLSQQLMYYIFKTEGKPKQDVDTLTVYLVIGTIISARLGHVIFYEPEIFTTDPLSVFLPFQIYPTFKFTGFQGLASHGAAFGILFTLWLYSRKKKPGQSYLQTVDRIVIAVAIVGALIRLGNFFNSEIIGKPTHSTYGIVFARNITDLLISDPNIEKVTYTKVDSASNVNGFVPVNIHPVLGKNLNLTKSETHNFVQEKIIPQLKYSPYAQEHIDQQSEFAYSSNNNTGTIKVFAIPRHPSQLYEAGSCVILFLILFFIWRKYKENLPPGLLLGLFLIICFGLRFLYEFLKENQEEFENSLPINMGQILSVPLVIAGIILLIWSLKRKANLPV